jgi:hypothetical protein
MTTSDRGRLGALAVLLCTIGVFTRVGPAHAAQLTPDGCFGAQGPADVVIPIKSHGRSYVLLARRATLNPPVVAFSRTGKKKLVIARLGWEFQRLSEDGTGFWYERRWHDTAPHTEARLAHFDSLLAFDFLWIEPDSARRLVGDRLALVTKALEGRDVEDLARLIHPTRGVQISIDTYITAEDLVFMPDQVRGARADTTRYLFGYMDSSDEPVYSTLLAMLEGGYARANFEDADSVSYNTVVGRGNTLNNVFEAFPGSIVVEYYFRGTGESADFNWSSRRLVFLECDDVWYLAGIVTDYWTI